MSQHKEDIPFNLSYYDTRTSLDHEYVVVRGHLPGRTDKLGAIMATHGIQGAHVLRYADETTAAKHWRRLLTEGNEVACLGTGPVWERTKYTNDLWREINEELKHGPGYWRASPSSEESPVPEKRKDRIVVPDSLRRGASVQSPIKKESVKLEPSSAVLSNEPASSTTTTSSADTTEAPANYAPPNDQGTGYVHPDLPDPVNAIRGTKGNRCWYVVTKSRSPGIYASWADVIGSNTGAAREPFKHGADTYEEAVRKWVRAREAGEIMTWA